MSVDTFSRNLDYLNKNGFLLIEKALDIGTVEEWRKILYKLYESQMYEIDNSVGNVAFEKLLKLQPKRARDLIGHKSVSPYLKAILGKQCQLRSLRAHLNPRDYTQEWHLDFYDYWHQEEKAEAGKPITGMCMNTTFYLTDNTPDRGRLTFVRDFFKQSVPDEMLAHWGYTDDRNNPFQAWCDGQPQVDLYPKAGDAVVFYSHIPHQGAKIGLDESGLIRANIVLHYQQNPMFPGIRFVSNPQFALDQLGYVGTFPFVDETR